MFGGTQDTARINFAFVYKTLTSFGLPSQIVRLAPLFPYCSPTTPGLLLVWALSVSLAATWEIEFSFSSSGYLDVSVLRVRSSMTILFIIGLYDITHIGFPHSDISGSMPACGSPKLFAAYHVLLRLLAPRHPPYALISFTLCFTFVYFFSSFLLFFFTSFLRLESFSFFFAKLLFALLNLCSFQRTSY